MKKKKKNSLESITWSEMGKQKVQAKGVNWQNTTASVGNDNGKTLDSNDQNQRFSLKKWFAGGAQSRGLRKPGCGHCYLRFFMTTSTYVTSSLRYVLGDLALILFARIPSSREIFIVKMVEARKSFRKCVLLIISFPVLHSLPFCKGANTGLLRKMKEPSNR